MRQRPLAQTSFTVSSLGLGTVKLGRNQQVKYPKDFDLPTDAEFLSLLDLAQQQGINFLDTAPAYGTSEERLGKLLGSRREDWVIMSKAGEDFVDGESVFDFSPSAIRESVERSLRRLDTDRVECLLLHSDGNDLEILNHSGAVEELFALKEEGKILAHGISTKTVSGGQRAIELGLDSVMVTYNPWHTEEEAVLDTAEESGTSVFLKKSLGSGWFGKEEPDEDPVEKSLRFVFSHPAATSAIIGTINPKHLVENCEAIKRVETALPEA
ncbi:MAG: aldo/keto reductase [Verrucomicrobiales bacterium]|nr:aldo/keto reductase [Verrucomicrobiales bacterium]